MGPDGNLWFAEFSPQGSASHPAGTVTQYTTGISANSGPQEIVAGPDGNMWFTERAGSRIGRITAERAPPAITATPNHGLRRTGTTSVFVHVEGFPAHSTLVYGQCSTIESGGTHSTCANQTTFTTTGTIELEVLARFELAPGEQCLNRLTQSCYIEVSRQGTTEKAIALLYFNEPPTCPAAEATTPEDTPIPVTLSCTDVDSDPLTYGVVSGPAHGKLSGSGASLTYTPDPNYNGSDSFTYKANDGKEDSNTATETLTVTPKPAITATPNHGLRRTGTTSVFVHVEGFPAHSTLVYGQCSTIESGGTHSTCANQTTFTTYRHHRTGSPRALRIGPRGRVPEPADAVLLHRSEPARHDRKSNRSPVLQRTTHMSRSRSHYPRGHARPRKPELHRRRRRHARL